MLQCSLDHLDEIIVIRLLVRIIFYDRRDGHNHLKLFLQTDFILGETEKVILQKKAEIYNSLSVSIQNDLESCYEGTTRHLLFSSF